MSDFWGGSPNAYDDACKRAATNQGLDPLTQALTAAGVKHEVEQTGGFTMVVAVPGNLDLPGTFTLTDDGCWMWGFWPGDTWREGSPDFEEPPMHRDHTLEQIVAMLTRAQED